MIGSVVAGAAPATAPPEVEGLVRPVLDAGAVVDWVEDLTARWSHPRTAVERAAAWLESFSLRRDLGEPADWAELVRVCARRRVPVSSIAQVLRPGGVADGLVAGLLLGDVDRALATLDDPSLVAWALVDGARAIIALPEGFERRLPGGGALVATADGLVLERPDLPPTAIASVELVARAHVVTTPTGEHVPWPTPGAAVLSGHARVDLERRSLLEIHAARLTTLEGLARAAAWTNRTLRVHELSPGRP